MLRGVHYCTHVTAFRREMPYTWDQEHIPYWFPKRDKTPAAPPLAHSLPTT